ncbi:MAG: carboxymuconolactone decarboxylase family protein [Fulvimonas sp.]|nr:carboxymuconolactone decarboxylase family protein [Fulvimonas sp.]
MNTPDKPAERGLLDFSRDSREFKDALALMGQVLGPAECEKIAGMTAHPLFGDAIGYLVSSTWGAAFHRPGLPLRDRAMLMIGTDLALGREGPLKDHIRIALHVGVTRQEIVEALFQSIFYVGAPGFVLGLKVAGEVFGAADAAQPAQAALGNVAALKDVGVRLGPINHVAMAVADWKKTARGFAALLGLKTWRELPIGSQMLDDARYYGQPAEFLWISAFARLGDTLLELCQPVSGKTMFGDFVARHGDGIQHIGDLSHPDPLGLVQAYTSQGIEVGTYGKIGGVAELFYLDTRAQLGGVVLEVVAPPTYAQIADFGTDVTFD